MIVAGVMSGTSADGIDVAVLRIQGRGYNCKLRLLAHQHVAYPPAVRKVLLASMNASQASVADLARMNFLLGELYSHAILRTLSRGELPKLDLVGCHGQTLYHQGEKRPFLSRKIAVTWQSGEGAVIAARTGVPVVTDFRPADMAAGGQGAPLVPFFDYVFYRSPRKYRILQNLGGIGNLTTIPVAATPDQVIAFDTGPANMVIDACMEHLFGKRYDNSGATAAKGMVMDKVVNQVLRDSFFRRKPPKTAGREQFGREFVSRFLALCGKTPKENVIATATALTARSIAMAVRALLGLLLPDPLLFKSTLPGQSSSGSSRKTPGEYIVAGGGSRNRTLMTMLEDELQPLGFRLRHSDEFGMPSQAKEAAAFALLAYQSWHRLPSNIPSATGADKQAILGKISYPPV